MTENVSATGVASLADEIARDDRLLRYSLHWSDEELDRWRLSPWRLNLQVTLGCNHRCISCSLRKRHPDELSLAEWQRVLREGVETIGVRAVSLTGGEPLVRQDLTEIVAFARSLGIGQVGLSSNMTLLGSLAEARRLLEAGLTGATVSYHGVGTHDRFVQREGAEEKVRQSLRWLAQAAGERGVAFDLRVATVLTTFNAAALERVLEFCEEIGAALYPELPDSSLPFFADTSIEQAGRIEEADVKNVVSALYRWIEAGRPVSLWKRNVPFVERYLARMPIESPCPMAFENVYVGATGNVFAGCWVLEPVGNVRTTSIAEICRSETYRTRARQVFRRECPGCSCGYRQMSAYYIPYILEGG